MKIMKHFYRLLCCILLIAVAVVEGQAAKRYGDPVQYKICPGDTIMVDTRQAIVFTDTIIYDTIVTSVNPPELDTLINVYNISMYPTFLKVEPMRTIERGTSFDWHGLTISRAGFYEKVFKSKNECDSIFRINVRERVETHITDTLCLGSSISFGNQTLTQAGIYRDSLHFADYDSIVVLSLIGHKPDTTIKNVRIPEGSSTMWNGKQYSTGGVYDTVYTDRFGCDSISRLVLTVYHVDTIDTVAVICPSESITWHGMTYSQTGKFDFPGTRSNGDRVIYRIDLTVKTLQEKPINFKVCDSEVVTFNGKTYTEAGTYYDKFCCDTTYKITITKTPSVLNLQTGVLDATHPYYWQYVLDGDIKTDTITAPGTYEYTTLNPETGCNDIWRLVLTKDETKYHFIEERTICASEKFDWHGKSDLNLLSIGQTTHYFDNYRTAADQDSIYELILTVNPVLSSSQTIKFCGSITKGGVTYTESSVLVDTLTSTQYGCDSIVTTILVKGEAFHLHDTLTLVPGETATWRGQTIDHDGRYEERHTSSFGCDSIYSLGVGYKAAAPVTNTHTDKVTICEGNYHEWRNHKYFNGGIYNDTVYINGDKTQGIDSIYILNLTVNPIYHSTERVTFTHFPAYYRDQEIYESTDYFDVHYTSSLGCDSIITVYVDRQVIRDEISATICPGETYRWRGHEYSEAYRYIETEKGADGKDSVEHILNLSVRYIPDTYITANICKGGSYTFANQVLTETGVYKYTFHDTGCDSVVTLSLNVLSADTNRFVHHMDPGQSYVWNGTTYRDGGTYFDYRTNRFGCDSINVLELTINHVDTVDTTVVLCPNEIPFFWHGIRANQTGEYSNTERQEDGSYTYYHLNLTVRELQRIDTTFTICGDETVSFNGKTYNQAGHYPDYLSCDTLVTVNIVKHPQQVYATTARLGGEHGYTWTFMNNGVEDKQTFMEPGTYEYESPNPTTGCSELWRLILIKDETKYHFVETLTICQGEDFSWQGLGNLSNQGIGSTSRYYANYTTRTGKDSIYELVLTVNPIKYSTQTIPFCESYTFNGHTYTTSQTIVDTLQTSLGCDSIVTTKLVKGSSFERHDTATIVPGETLYWRGLTITNSGQYEVKYTSASGCDSTYTLGVGMKEAAPQMNLRTWNEAICEGDYYEWPVNGQRYYNEGTYVDTVFVGSTKEVDSLLILNLTVHPIYRWSERITSHTFPFTYRGHEFTYDGETYVIPYKSSLGCDSIITVYAAKQVYRTEDVITICRGDEYIWKWDHKTYTETGRYVLTIKDHNDKDSVEHILNLTVKYIPDTYITKTICNGSSYTFGDKVLTETGSYDYTFSQDGCDSIVHLSLNVLSADTNKVVRHRNPNDPPIDWNGHQYTETGTYFHYTTNRFGCDSVNVLILTVNKVDTIDTIASICPSETLHWHGIHASQTGDYSNSEQQTDGSYNYYRLHLTVRPLVERDTTFTICGDESVYFNGTTFTQGGIHDTYLACDTLIHVHINKKPQQVYVTNATLGGEHGYTWTFMNNGVEDTKNFTEPGTYEYESPNPTTGCSEIWRLILTRDENEYHFEETLTICEGADFTWHGQAGLSHQHIGETWDYTAPYKTRNDKDSIYTLHLTVTPIQRTYRTIRFCGETIYKGTIYTSSAQIKDTLTAANGCDSIITINLDKVNSYHFIEYYELPQGKQYRWHDIDIQRDGVYRDNLVSQYGCDSIYELRVTIIPATPQTNQFSLQTEICENKLPYLWRTKELLAGGTYVDTVWTADQKVDSIFTLDLTVWPSYEDTIIRHMYTCNDGSAIYYQGKAYYENDTVISTFPTSHGCDSIVKVFMHFNTAEFHSDTARIAENKLPYEWRPNNDTTILLTEQGVHQYQKQAEGGCNNTWELFLEVYPLFTFKDSVSVCEADLPYYWDRGPSEHSGEGLSGTAGQTTTIRYAYTSTITGADSIYELKLYIMPQVKHIEQIHLCAGDQVTLDNGKTYFNLEMDSIYRDTIPFPNPNIPGCDSIVYYEIRQLPVKNFTETTILHHDDEPIVWKGNTITSGGTYNAKPDSIDAVTGCKVEQQLIVIQEMYKKDTICILDTPYVWDGRNKEFYTTGYYTDTVRDAQGHITQFWGLDLQVDDVPRATEQHYVCYGYPETFHGRWFGRPSDPTDTVYRFNDTILSPDYLKCDSVIMVEVHVSSVKEHHETIILPAGDTYDWNGQEITKGGTYTKKESVAEGCDSISYLHVIEELRIEKTICRTDTTEDTPADKKYPYVWVHQREGVQPDTLYTSGIYTDTTFDNEGYITEFYTLHLTIVHPYDTTIYVHGCSSDGAWWYGQPNEIFHVDTSFIYRKEVSPADPNAPCDSIFYVNITIDTVYTTNIIDTICEWELPYILGRVDPDTIWGPTIDNPGNKQYTHNDITVNGCDSIINLTLYIIPSLPKNDSTFVCQEFFTDGGYIWLGDTVTPWFDTKEGGKFHGKWEGKWHGVPFSNDTIVYNCDSTLSHHIIVEPIREMTKDTFYLCQGDSVQLFWPNKETWVKKEGVYYDTLPAYSLITNKTHQPENYEKNYLCDSIIEWTVYMLDTIHEDTIVHIAKGDSLFWNNEWRYAAGLYDSISYEGPSPMPASGTAIQGANSLELPLKDSRGLYCKYVMTLHLFVDDTYYFRDTLSVCDVPKRDTLYTWADGYEMHFRLPGEDSAYHRIDTLNTLLYRFDSIYDLYVDFHQTYFNDTVVWICEGDEYRFDLHHRDNTVTQRFLKTDGIYYDTIAALNGCDSITRLRLWTYDSVPTTYTTHMIRDIDVPYYWENTWKKLDGTDTTQVDTLRSTGRYSITMWNKHGCDSTIVLDFTVHQTHVFTDTLELCEFSNTTVRHTWPTNFESKFNTPNKDTASFHVYDTLETRIKYDSIYDLFVIFKQKTIQYMDTNICFGDSIQFGLTRAHSPRFIYKSGIYQDTLIRTTNGCDSIIELRVNVRDLYENEVTKHISIADTPYIWQHIGTGGIQLKSDTLYAEGTYIYRYDSQFGCDSIDTLHLFIHQQYLFRDTVQICSDETPYTWGNKHDIYTTGEYIQYLRTHDDRADSTHVRYVRVMPVEHDTITATICEGDSLRWGLTKANKPRFLYTSDTYNDTLPSIHGCDSIITLRLTVYPRYYNDTTVHIADIDTPYVWKHYQAGVEIAKDSLYTTGDYRYTFKSAFGCDSIDSLHLFIHKTYYITEDTINICYDQIPYKWHELDNITKTGDYENRGTTQEGYDSIYYVHINVWKQVYDTVTYSICEGDSMRWGLTKANKPRFVYNAGLYNDTLMNIHGCDSIIVLRLNTYPRYFNDTTVHIADIDTPYVWKHYQAGVEIAKDSLYTTGDYRYTFKSAFGCDSIDSLHLFIHKTYYITEDTINICYDQIPYKWHELDNITKTGDYENRRTTQEGYDSIYYVHINVWKQVYDTVTYSICEGDSMRWGLTKANKPRFVYNAGLYNDTLMNIHGCDSIIVLRLNIFPRHYKDTTVHIADVDTPFVWKHYQGSVEIAKDSLYAEGRYGYKFNSTHACDSIDSLTLYIHKTYKFTEEITICERETPYTWKDQNGITESGTYYYNPRTKDGYDSIYIATITVVPTMHKIIQREVCANNLPFDFHGQALMEGGIFKDTITSDNGCDSIVELHLTVNYPFYHFERHDIYQGETYNFFGQPCTTSGTYTHSTTTPAGCDSITEIMLVVHPLIDTTAIICSNDLPFIWVNHWTGDTTLLHSAGLYHNDTTYVNGERTFWSIQLIVKEPTVTVINESICEGESNYFAFKGQNLTTAGIYRDTLQTADGCDSIIELHLTVNKPYYNYIERHIIQGQSVEILGLTFDKDTLHTIKGLTANHCDSIIDIKVIMHPAVDTVVTVCSNDLPYIWVNKWNGQTTPLYAAGIYRNDTTIVNGKQMYYGLQLIVKEPTVTVINESICEGESNYFAFKGQNLTTAGIYRDTLQTADGCDSIIELHLTINKPYYNYIERHIIQGQSVEVLGLTFNKDTLHTIKGLTANHCDSIIDIKVIMHPAVDTVVTVCSNDLPYIWVNKWNGQTTPLYTAGIYRNDTTIVNGKQMYYGLQLIVKEPTVTVINESICEGESNYFSFKGQNLTTAGIYRDTLQTADGCDSIIELHLTVNKPYYNYIERHIIQGQSVEILGLTFDKDTLHTIKGLTANHCDSIIDIKVIMHPAVDTVVTVCSNDLPYIWVNKWNGQTTPLYAAGIYRNDTTIVNGKQMYYGLQLIVKEPTVTVINESICEGESNYFSFKGQNLTTAGIYRDTLQTADGCDSIIELHLTVNKPYYNYIERHIIQGQSVEILGLTFDKDTLHTIKGLTANHCDSIIDIKVIMHPAVDTVVTVCSNDLPYIWVNKWNGQTTPLYAAGIYRNDTTIVNGKQMYYGLQLIVKEPTVTAINESICEGESNYFSFKGQNLTTAGIYRDTLQTADGCDSIIELHLTVNKPYYNYIERHIIEGQSVEILGLTFNKDTLHTIKGLTANHCDSIIDIKVIMHPAVDTVVTVCSNDLPYIWVNKWNGQTTPLYAAGIYRNDTTIVNGKQMYYGLQLIVKEPTVTVINESICEGESNYFSFKGQNLTTAGIYRDTLQTADGCDSIIELHLTVNKPYYNYIERHIIEGQSVEILGLTFNKDTLHTIKGLTANHCDSIIDIKVIMHPAVDTVVTVCSNDLPYIWVNKWNGQTTPLYAAGIYRNDTTIVNGKQMYYGLQLIVKEPTVTVINESICEGESNYFSFKGQNLTTAGIYRDTLQTADGCDSIIELHLTINKPYYNYIERHIIQGQSVEILGLTFDKDTLHTIKGLTANHCDSIIDIKVIMHPAVDTVVTVCSNDLPYIWVNKWNGQTTPLYAAGIYRNDTTIVNGKQMYYGLQLIVKEPTVTVLNESICEGDRYYFNGYNLMTSGEYRDTLRNLAGCDSIVILHLNVLPKYHQIITRSIFEGDTVHFQDEVYSTAGNYPVRMISSYGCDSILELRLIVKRMYDDSVTVCANELPLEWRNRSIYESGVYYDTVTVDGDKVITGLKVKVLPIARASEPIVATICEGDFYKFGDSVLTTQGTYYDTLTAANGCDSIVMLALQVLPVRYQSEVRRIFEGDTVFFYGDTLTTSGVYEHRVKNGNNCTDTYQLILTVLKSSVIDTTAYVCKNDLPFIWRGYEYNESGDYTLPITWTDSSRVVMNLHLTVNDTYYGERNISLCSGDEFRFNDRVYNTNSEFYDTIPSKTGCDSIIKYIISIHPTYDHIFEKHISDKQPYVFHDRILNTSGTYEWTGKTVNGCDSMEHLILVVHPSYFYSDTIDLCQSDSINYPYKWRNIEISQSGVYSDSLLTSPYGFDSVYQIVVNVHPAYFVKEQYEIGDGEVLKIHGRDISKPAIYYDTLRTIHGCDSIFHVVVNQKRTREFTWTREICSGEFFDFFGRKLSHTGQYRYVSQYKDSIVTLNLTVNPISITENRVVITDKQLPYVFSGKIYDNAGVYNDTLVNKFGCDSILRLVLVVTTHYSAWTPVPLCPGTELKIDGQVITEAGLYTFLRRSRETGEMDSIYRVEVYEAPAYEFDIERTMCQGDTFFVGDKPITRGGHHDIRLKTREGCDSIYHLDLTVWPSYHFITDTTITDYQKVVWRGLTYTKSGNYDMSWPTIHDCDSTYTLSLHVIPTQRDTVNEIICNGQSYTWRGRTYSVDGVYTDTVWMPEVQYSAIYTLRLMVAYPTTITSARTGDVCADTESFDVYFEYTGQKPTYYSVYFDALAKREGFVDIINAPLYGEMVAHIDMPKFASIAYETHPYYVRPDYYTLHIVLDNGVCGVSRSDSVSLLIKYPSWIIEQNWNDVVVPLKAEYNGGYEFAQTEWYVNGVIQQNATAGYLYNPDLIKGDKVVMKATRKGEKYAIPTCPLVITDPATTGNDTPVIVYPTQAPRHAPVVTVEAPHIGTYEVYSSTGLNISTGELYEGGTKVTLPTTSGIYFIRVHQGNAISSHKVLVY